LSLFAPSYNGNNGNGRELLITNGTELTQLDAIHVCKPYPFIERLEYGVPLELQ
jgi:hypothetical protein